MTKIRIGNRRALRALVMALLALAAILFHRRDLA